MLTAVTLSCIVVWCSVVGCAGVSGSRCVCVWYAVCVQTRGTYSTWPFWPLVDRQAVLLNAAILRPQSSLVDEIRSKTRIELDSRSTLAEFLKSHLPTRCCISELMCGYVCMIVIRMLNV